MNALGIVSESATATSTLRPRFIPSFGFYEMHQSNPIDAAPPRIIDAVASLDMRSDAVVDTLLTVRELPQTLVDVL